MSGPDSSGVLGKYDAEGKAHERKTLRLDAAGTVDEAKEKKLAAIKARLAAASGAGAGAGAAVAPRPPERLRAALAVWSHAAEVARHFRATSARIARKASRGLLWDALHRWAAGAAAQRRLGSVLQRCAARLTNARVGAAFESWVEAACVDQSKQLAVRTNDHTYLI